MLRVGAAANWKSCFRRVSRSDAGPTTLHHSADRNIDSVEKRRRKIADGCPTPGANLIKNRLLFAAAFVLGKIFQASLMF